MRAEEDVRRNEALKTAILNSAFDAVIAIDHQGRVLEFNPAAERMFGYERDQAIGQEMDSLIIPPRLRDRHRRGLERFSATGEGPILGKRIELPGMRADGTEFPVELSITRIGDQEPAMFTGLVIVYIVVLACLVNLAASMWACGIAMRIRSIQAFPLMQLPVFLILFMAPVYVPLELVRGWVGAIAPLNPLCERDLFRRIQQRVAADLAQEHLQRVGGRGQCVCLEDLLLGELVVGLFEQVLNFRGFQDRANGASFR